MARPAFARVFGEWEERREDVEAVSAASSAERRESWVLAKAEGSSGGSGFRRSIFLGGVRERVVCGGCVVGRIGREGWWMR